MHETAVRSEYGRRWSAVLVAALVPLASLSFFTAPQTDDFCYGALALQGGFAGIWHHYQTWSGRLVASVLIPLPTIVSSLFRTDLFTAYATFSFSFVLGFLLLCYWLTGELLPNGPSAERLFFALALFIVLVANAPTTRQMVFWIPGAFTYSLPAFVTLPLFMSLHRALADRTWLPCWQFLLFTAALFLAALCNELTGPITATMVGLSLYVRRRLAFERVQTGAHVVLIVAALTGALIVSLAPGSTAREATFPGSGNLISALLWGTFRVPVFFALHLPRPGVLGWCLVFGLMVAQYPPLRPDRRRTCSVFGFAISTPLGACWVAFVAGYYGQGSSLPDRAQNLLFFLSILSLSCTLALGLRMYGGRLLAWLSHHLPEPLGVKQLQWAGVVLLLLSPALLSALRDLPDAAAFRRETRAQLLAISNDPRPIVQVRQIETRPRLLFNNRLSRDGHEWPNRCLARYFHKDAVVPK